MASERRETAVSEIHGQLFDERGGELSFCLQLGARGIEIRLQGYGEKEALPGRGSVAFLEFRSGQPCLHVWPDITKADPLSISLDKASEDLRREDRPALIGYDYWDDHLDHPRSSWQAEVAAGSTGLGYWDWVREQLAAAVEAADAGGPE